MATSQLSKAEKASNPLFQRLELNQKMHFWPALCMATNLQRQPLVVKLSYTGELALFNKAIVDSITTQECIDTLLLRFNVSQKLLKMQQKS